MSAFKKMKIMGGATLLAGAIAVGLAQARTASVEPAETPAKPSVIRPVLTAVAQESSTSVIRTFPGVVRACRRVELAFEMSGLLMELNAQEGKKVSKGEIIAKLDSRECQNNFDAAKASFDDAARTYNRAMGLWNKKVITRSEYDKALSAWEIAGAQLRVQEKNLTDTVLTAPFDGIIAARNVDNFQRVNARQEVVSLQDISRIEVVIQIPERLIAHGGTDEFRNIKVRFDADGARWFKAKIQEYRVQPDTATRTYDVVMTLVPPEDVTILPGMTAAVQLEINTDTSLSDTTQQTVTVPAEAIWNDGYDRSYVWIIPSVGGKPTRKEIEIGRLKNNSVFIVSGLKAGEHVAIAGLNAISEDIIVRPRIAGKKGLDG